MPSNEGTSSTLASTSCSGSDSNLGDERGNGVRVTNNGAPVVVLIGVDNGAADGYWLELTGALADDFGGSSDSDAIIRFTGRMNESLATGR